MGMYTEFLFQGKTKKGLTKDIQELIDYFFYDASTYLIGDVEKNKLTDHPFFSCPRWSQIGHMSSYYFNPFCLRYSKKHVIDNEGAHVFLLCNLKNYDNEIELFINWVDSYMDEYWGHHWYEEDDVPTFFKVRK